MTIFYQMGAYAARCKIAGIGASTNDLARALMLRSALGGGLAGGGVGAFIGGLAAEEGNRLQGAVAGGALGAALGSGTGSIMGRLRGGMHRRQIGMAPLGEASKAEMLQQALAGEGAQVIPSALLGIPAGMAGSKVE